MRIGIDFDSTIVNSTKAIFEIYKEETNQPTLQFNNCYGWDFEGLIPRDYYSRAMELFSEEKFTAILQALPNAIEVINKIHEMGHEIIICSKHAEARKIHTMLWVKKNLPYAKLIFTDSFDKSCMKDKADIFVDDKIECLESLVGYIPYVVCFGEYEWNKEWRREGRITARDWNEFLELFKVITVIDVVNE